VTDIWPSKKRSEVMSRIRKTDSRPEVLLRSHLRSAGVAFQTYTRLPGTPDIVMESARACGVRPWVLLARLSPPLSTATQQRRILVHEIANEQGEGQGDRQEGESDGMAHSSCVGMPGEEESAAFSRTPLEKTREIGSGSSRPIGTP